MGFNFGMQDSSSCDFFNLLGRLKIVDYKDLHPHGGKIPYSYKCIKNSSTFKHIYLICF